MASLAFLQRVPRRTPNLLWGRTLGLGCDLECRGFLKVTEGYLQVLRKFLRDLDTGSGGSGSTRALIATNPRGGASLLPEGVGWGMLTRPWPEQGREAPRRRTRRMR